MTPDERTELQRLAEAQAGQGDPDPWRTYCSHRCLLPEDHEGVHFHGYNLPPDKQLIEDARAEREELRAENERLKVEDYWGVVNQLTEERNEAQAERDTALSDLERERRIHEVTAGALRLNSEELERLTTLESRYSALESAARTLRDRLADSWPDDDDLGRARDAFDAALDSLPQGTPHDPSEGVQE